MPYIGTSSSNGVKQTYDYTATDGQTSFSGSDNNSQTLTYTDSTYIDVYQTGILLIPSDYTATTGTTVVLHTDATESDTLQIVVYNVNAEIEAKVYQRNRAAGYPSIADQLDDIYHNGVDEWKKTIKAVKDKYPKE